MKKTSRILTILMVLALSLSLYACSEKGLKTGNLSTYTIVMELDDAQKTVSVKQTVDYVNEYDIELSRVNFHLYPNAFRQEARFKPVTADEFDKAYPNGASYGKIEINSVKVAGKAAEIKIEGQDDDILVVELFDYLMPSAKVTIEMEYVLTIPNVRHRFGYYNKTINLGNFYPIACIYENGGFNTSPYYSNGDPFYSAAANYKVTITAPSKYTAAMSGVSIVTEIGEVNKTFATVQGMRDFAIVLGEFSSISGTADGVGVTYYYYDDPEADSSLKIAQDSIKTFNEIFGEYPYLSLAVVQTSFLHGGMEYPGLVYISDAEKGEIYRDVIVHEAAHQWWYGIVGNNQISNAWLDETLAEYAATLFYEKNPLYNIAYEKRISDALGGYLLYCDLFSYSMDTSMNRSLGDFNDSLEYTYMTYTKGQIMMDTLRKTIGDKSFFAAFKKYFNDNYLKIAEPDNLISCFEYYSKRDLKSFFSTWLEGNVVMYGT